MVESKSQNVGTQGVGSSWNANNWHWESRNYTNFAKEYLTKELAKIVLTTSDASIEIYEAKTLTGEASVTVRKGKQIFMFEFEGELYFKAKNLQDERTDCSGKVKFFEINQEDDEIQVEVTCEKPGNWVDGVKRALKGPVADKILSTLLSLSKAMKEKDSNDAKVARDKAEREAAKQAFQETTKATAEVRTEITAAQKQREEEMKKIEAAKAVPQPVLQKQDSKLEGQGSVWNTGNYFWESKNVQKWSDDTLKEICSTFNFTQGDTVLKITEVKELKGDAEVNVRKGKKLVTYDYQIKLGWELSLFEKVGGADQKVVGKMEGTYFFPEMSNDEEENGWECNISFGKDEQNLQSVFNQLIRLFAVDALKETIKMKYVKVLKEK